MVRSTRCGCGAVCSCTFEGGTGVGVVQNPDGSFTVTQGQGNTTITVADSESLDFTISGLGVTGSPYTITAIKVPGAPLPGVAVDRQDFYADGVWTKPYASGICEVFVHGGGGGGGGGGTVPAVPGGGGGGGGLSRRWFRLADLPASLNITIGQGGAGGLGAVDSSSAGLMGEKGGTSSFGTLLFAGGGDGGYYLYAVNGGPGTEFGGSSGTYKGAFDYEVGRNHQSTGLASSAGGMGGYFSPSGGSVPTGADSRDGADGGQIYGGGFHFYGTGGDWDTETSATPGIAGIPYANDGGTGGGGGHGGGESRSRQPGAAGGAGGGGGGGGGAGSTAGGAGGPGGSGRVVVICWPGT